MLNEWNKFEKIVRTNTNFETNPGEFDYVYGAYWRAANGKQVRFDEIYEKSLVVDVLLKQSNADAGKLLDP